MALFKFFSHQTLKTMLTHRISNILWFGLNSSYFEAGLLSITSFSPTLCLDPDKSLLNDIRHPVKQYFIGKKQVFQLLGSVQNSNKNSDGNFRYNKLSSSYVVLVYFENFIYLSLSPN